MEVETVGTRGNACGARRYFDPIDSTFVDGGKVAGT